MEIVQFLNREFWKNSDYFLLFVLSILWILVNKKGEKTGKYTAIYSLFIFIVVICNPVIATLGLRFFSDDKWAYMRIFYLIPLMSLIAYAGTEIYTTFVRDFDARRKKMVFAFVIVFTICLSGSFYEKAMYRETTNIYKIDQNALEISDIINEDCDNTTVTAYVPNAIDIHYGIRQYAGNIMIIGNSDLIENNKDLDILVNETECQYLVLSHDSKALSNILNQGFVWIGETGDYTVFKRGETI